MCALTGSIGIIQLFMTEFYPPHKLIRFIHSNDTPSIHFRHHSTKSYNVPSLHVVSLPSYAINIIRKQK